MSSPVGRRFRHWHKTDERASELTEPPECCSQAAQRAVEAEVRQARHAGEEALTAERRRLVTEALTGIESYATAAVSLLDDQAAAALVRKVAERCADVVRTVACICPRVDVSTLSEGPGTRFVPGWDPRCGAHAHRGVEGDHA
jgi:hypothetical protein